MYANYGTVDDFRELETRNLNCTGKIVIMRYGKIFRGNKVAFDYQLLIFSFVMLVVRLLSLWNPNVFRV